MVDPKTTAKNQKIPIVIMIPVGGFGRFYVAMIILFGENYQLAGAAVFLLMT